MAQPVSEDLDKALQGSGYKKDQNDDYYWRSNGRVESRKLMRTVVTSRSRTATTGTSIRTAISIEPPRNTEQK